MRNVPSCICGCGRGRCFCLRSRAALCLLFGRGCLVGCGGGGALRLQQAAAAQQGEEEREHDDGYGGDGHAFGGGDRRGAELHDHLVAAGGHVELWSPETSALDSILEGHDADVTCCSFAGHRLATGGADGNVKITNLRTTVCDTIHVGNTVVDVQWSPDGCHLAACTSNSIRIWGGDKEEVIHEHISSISWKSPSILAVALADAVGTIRLYQIPRAHVLKEFTTGCVFHDHPNSIARVNDFV